MAGLRNGDNTAINAMNAAGLGPFPVPVKLDLGCVHTWRFSQPGTKLHACVNAIL